MKLHPRIKGRRWTAEDDDRLKSLIEANMSTHLIAAKMKRTTHGKWSREHTGHINQTGMGTRGEMTRGRHPKRFKVTWCVSFEPKERLLGQRALRKTETFRNEQDAKAFAKATLSDGSNINAGTLNPYQPKQVITSVEIYDWLNNAERPK
jgi:hypothetical protein